MVGAGGFEPPTSCSRSMRANRTALRPAYERFQIYSQVTERTRRSYLGCKISLSTLSDCEIPPQTDETLKQKENPKSKYQIPKQIRMFTIKKCKLGGIQLWSVFDNKLCCRMYILRTLIRPNRTRRLLPRKPA